MSRRVLPVSLFFLLVLAFASMMFFNTGVRAQTGGPGSATPTSLAGAQFVGTPLTGAAPLAVQFTHLDNTAPLYNCSWIFGDGTSQSFTLSGSSARCPTVTHTYTVAGSYTVTLYVTKNTTLQSNQMQKLNYVLVGGPTSTPAPTSSTQPDLTISAIDYIGSSPACANAPKDRVTIANIGGGAAGTFVVSFNGQTQTVSGLGAGLMTSLTFNAVSSANVMVDSTQVIAESNETNNTMSANLPIPTQAPTCTPTGPTPTFTRTPTPTGPAPTLTRTPTLGGPVCSPVSATIAAPFIFDGAGTFCWQASTLGSHINNWNTASVTINGVNITGQYVGSGSYPAKVNGFWYIRYTANFAWSHFETK